MNCTNCGQPLDNGAAFCGNCGQPVQQAAAPATTVSPVVTASSANVSPQPVVTAPAPAGVPEQQVPAVSPSQPIVQTPVEPAQFQPQQTTSPVTPAAAPAAPTGQTQTGLPAYAVPQPDTAHTKKSGLSLTFGIISVVMSFWPIVGLATGITAIILSSKAKKIVHKSGLATAGLVLGIIGVIFSVIGFGYNLSVSSNSNSTSTAIVQSLR